MYITHSPAEKRRVLFFQITNVHTDVDAGAGGDPKPARDVAPDERWAFTDHRTLAEVIAEGPALMPAERSSASAPFAQQPGTPEPPGTPPQPPPDPMAPPPYEEPPRPIPIPRPDQPPVIVEIVDLGNGWGLTAYGDVGGFGVGAHTDWQVLGTVDYTLSPSWNLHLGYRSLNFNITGSEGRFGFNVHMRGPIIAGTFRF